MTRRTAAIVLAAGKGTRMKSDRAKVLHAVAGKPMIGHVLDQLAAVDVDRTLVVVGPDMAEVADVVAPAVCVTQDQPLGTAHAVLATREAMAGFDGDVLVLFGDTPLLTADTISAMIEARRAPSDPAVVVLGFRPEDPAHYGRLVTGDDGSLRAIVEYRDATEEQRGIGLCNAGIMALDGRRLFDMLDLVRADNAKREFYLTDVVSIAREFGFDCAVVEAADPEEVQGVNARAELARAEAAMQGRLRARAMDGGATLIDPDTVYLSSDTRLGADSIVGPNVVFGPGVTVGEGVVIKAFSHLEGTEIENGATIGPFARLRPGAKIGEHVHIGNFVEIKAADVEAGAKVNHLSYVGDARVGAGANVGAGTITCNYDGFTKSRTDIGAGAFIGSNTALVAPVKVGDGAFVGAGSVITASVDPDALALTRAPMTVRDGGAIKYRAQKQAAKQKKTG